MEIAKIYSGKITNTGSRLLGPFGYCTDNQVNETKYINANVQVTGRINSTFTICGNLSVVSVKTQSKIIRISTNFTLVSKIMNVGITKFHAAGKPLNQ